MNRGLKCREVRSRNERELIIDAECTHVFIISYIYLFICLWILQQVSVLHSSAVIRELLQSCYTGILQFSAKEIVNYLTAASYLQMEHVVEKCRVALSQYLQSKSSSSVVSRIRSIGFDAVLFPVRSTHLDAVLTFSP